MNIYNICKEGNIELIKQIKEEECNYNLGLEGACEGGHQELVEYLLSKATILIWVLKELVQEVIKNSYILC